MKNICVYGSSSAALDKIYFDAATSLGALLAQAGYGLVFGAGNMGLMGAAARGVHSKGGYVTGVIPEFMNVDDIPYKKCDELIVTQTMRERKQIMEEKSDGFIAAPGGIGTFEEFFEILTLKQLKQHKKPVVLLNTNNYYNNIQDMMELCVSEQFAKEQTLELYTMVDTPEQAVEYISNYKHKDFALKWFTATSKE
ncbi:TIGR00730 family Rossman fold protein [Christensenellaceae bacterium OttesenSCG-928-K19]|nr:TIGR00730 family Rossman fold protein [Christensenellaceae bacterium OttesenSCG-928-K19]